MKIETELAAHGELIGGLQNDTITLKRRVDDLHDRFVIVEGSVVKLTATVERDVTPLLAQNTEICARVERKVDKLGSVETLSAKVDDIKEMLRDYEQKRAEREYRRKIAVWLKTTSGTVSSLIAASVAIGAGAVWLVNHFVAK